ncbi:MAG: Mo-dependent nitrogenase C-terminal domain-containing protein [cyanobacterium endosymbiont of Rhopalodia musculus]|uniref:Mo-dependent nitrogenase C-terminal domain-containing protein n=1 Tax=cyanobacterium endosymbiont of Epithemia clementina EcSB TaxID=3034674 RepID=UPI00247FB26B|nr:Mo-dependent nitrogenase C-terminal domain-containing protein [cyanobacterium endosymbiont of Epithemia clementina EcSB]WGT67788.1 Mo-dependent nitrogenase C-terminal domain-containing protein [cyanobacterium endosymbiont of Epithemia clementina EcSB]
MAGVAQSSYTETQISAWLRGLLTIAWADGHYDPEEQDLISQLTHDLALDNITDVAFKAITPKKLARALGPDENTAENFLRTAVLVAIADGIYSPPEAELLHQFSDALGLKVEALKSLEHTLCSSLNEHSQAQADGAAVSLSSPPHPHPDLLHPLKDWLDGMDINDPRLARFICKMVPSQCPFERDVKLFGHKIVHIPALCKLNPLYEQLVGLRFRALCYLSDDCKEDISEYV